MKICGFWVSSLGLEKPEFLQKAQLRVLEGGCCVEGFGLFLVQSLKRKKTSAHPF